MDRVNLRNVWDGMDPGDMQRVWISGERPLILRQEGKKEVAQDRRKVKRLSQSSQKRYIHLRVK